MIEIASPLAQFSFPRTGKRGVPQQFPRRLYEMLDGETKSVEADSDNQKIISWSDSGKAFRIYDVAEFASIVLPKYFRTKKFSSFQRNLNLYGFTKVRRGVDTDMYAHPSFSRDQPESLLQLHKIATRSRHQLVSDPSREPRPVSPPLCHQGLTQGSLVSLLTTSQASKKIMIHGFNEWDQAKPTHVSPVLGSCYPITHSESDASSTGSNNDRGKLDLLAFALEREFASRP